VLLVAVRVAELVWELRVALLLVAEPALREEESAPPASAALRARLA
jgi:hypothetical protein